MIATTDSADISHFQKLKAIGNGGSSVVFKCMLQLKDSKEPILGAVKEISKNGLTPAQIKVIEGEIDMLKSLSHPNIIHYLGTDQTSTHFSIFLEYASRGSIRQMYLNFGPLQEDLIAYLLRQSLQGLNYLHKKDIAHRDIKGANILLTADGQVKLADFGSSKHYKMESLVGGLKGTPHFMAPEVIRGDQALTGWIKADIWSIGAVAVELVTGNLPYSKYENSMTVMFKIASGESPPLFNQRNSDKINCSDEFFNFYKLCCSFDPMERPSIDTLLVEGFLRPKSIDYISLFKLFLADKDDSSDNTINVSSPKSEEAKGDTPEPVNLADEIVTKRVSFKSRMDTVKPTTRGKAVSGIPVTKSKSLEIDHTNKVIIRSNNNPLGDNTVNRSNSGAVRTLSADKQMKGVVASNPSKNGAGSVTQTSNIAPTVHVTLKPPSTLNLIGSFLLNQKVVSGASESTESEAAATDSCTTASHTNSTTLNSSKGFAGIDLVLTDSADSIDDSLVAENNLANKEFAFSRSGAGSHHLPLSADLSEDSGRVHDLPDDDGSMYPDDFHNDFGDELELVVEANSAEEANERPRAPLTGEHLSKLSSAAIRRTAKEELELLHSKEIFHTPTRSLARQRNKMLSSLSSIAKQGNRSVSADGLYENARNLPPLNVHNVLSSSSSSTSISKRSVKSAPTASDNPLLLSLPPIQTTHTPKNDRSSQRGSFKFKRSPVPSEKHGTIHEETAQDPG